MTNTWLAETGATSALGDTYHRVSDIIGYLGDTVQVLVDLEGDEIADADGEPSYEYEYMEVVDYTRNGDEIWLIFSDDISLRFPADHALPMTLHRTG